MKRKKRMRSSSAEGRKKEKGMESFASRCAFPNVEEPVSSMPEEAVRYNIYACMYPASGVSFHSACQRLRIIGRRNSEQYRGLSRESKNSWNNNTTCPRVLLLPDDSDEDGQFQVLSRKSNALLLFFFFFFFLLFSKGENNPWETMWADPNESVIGERKRWKEALSYCFEKKKGSTTIK